MKIKEKKILEAANFIEEFAWLLKSKRNINFEEIATILRELSLKKSDLTLGIQSQSNSKMNDLVGILPFLFQDKDLFQLNKDIIDFAENLFNIKISRPEKRTRYELIGFVVTEITNLNKTNLNRVINALSLISNDIEKLKEIKKAKKEINFSWNNAISNLNK